MSISASADGASFTRYGRNPVLIEAQLEMTESDRGN